MRLVNAGGEQQEGQESNAEAGAREEEDFRPERVCELCAAKTPHTVAHCGAFGANWKQQDPETRAREEQRRLEQAEEQLKKEREEFAARTCWKKK
jgi:hypothetical protein